LQTFKLMAHSKMAMKIITHVGDALRIPPFILRVQKIG